MTVLLALQLHGGAAEIPADGEGVRRIPLSAPGIGRTGFTLLPSSRTGVTSSNSISDEAVAANRILENGSGVALGDVDGDGRCDLYFCRLSGGNVLYRNLGDWKFIDVTAEAGVACLGQASTGAVLEDIDGDGDLDLLVNGVGVGTRLFLNDGHGHFTESLDSGLKRQGGSTSLSLADIDGDGDLDLFVANYRANTFKDRPAGVERSVRRVGNQWVVTPADRFEARTTTRGDGVIVLELGEPNVLYINKGSGRFGAVGWTGGAFIDAGGATLREPPRDWTLSAMFRDIDLDGRPDLYTCNDFILSLDGLWMNRNGKKFQMAEPHVLRHVSMSSMAVDFADINRDGLDDFIVVDMLSADPVRRQRQRPNFLKGQFDHRLSDPDHRPEVSRNTVFLNRGDGTYAEIGQLAGLAATDWSWNALFVDVDLDGFEDLLVANGHDHDVIDADTMREVSATPGGASAGEHRRNLLKFPRLDVPKKAYRNRGDLTFQDVSGDWGFDTRGIAHGAALADLDGDGDLDLVLNNLNAPAGIYRNDGVAPRIAVRLRGKSGNTRGIGARIEVRGGAVPVQTQQMISGGRYLSSDDAIRTFAAGSVTNQMTLEITWRSGMKSKVTGVVAGFLYEVDEVAARPAEPVPPPAAPGAMFEDATALLGHRHDDAPSDEFERLPFLTHGLSHRGPAVAWTDVDGDGVEDLVIGAGRGGHMAVLRNLSGRGFSAITNPALVQPVAAGHSGVVGWPQSDGTSVVIAGLNAQDDPTADQAGAVLGGGMSAAALTTMVAPSTTSPGPVNLVDLDGDGVLELFVGGRAIVGRYPEPASSQVFRRADGKWIPASMGTVLDRVGLVNGAVFSDLDGDGLPELVLAPEWGAIRMFRNHAGKLESWDPPLEVEGEVTGKASLRHLHDLTGWWTGVTAGDFDGDGRMDLAVGNWGRNTKYQSSLARPLRLYRGEFGGEAGVGFLEAVFEPSLGKYAPCRDLDATAAAVPDVRVRFATYRGFGAAGIEEILGDHLRQATVSEAATLDSVVLLNRGDHWLVRPLPVEAQFAPVFGMNVADIDGDGREDLLLAQNFFQVEPETSRYDAGLGLWLKGDGKGGFQAMSAANSGLRVWGEQRGSAVADYDGDGRVDWCVSQNAGATRLFHNVGGKPGLRVRLKGPAGNPTAIGARLRLRFDAGEGPVREVHAGSGYGSQDSAVQILALASPARKIRIDWPGGARSELEIPPGAGEIEVSPVAGLREIKRSVVPSPP